MTKRKPRNSLGKGLDALLGEMGTQDWKQEDNEPDGSGSRLIAVDRIRAAGSQPRTYFDEESLKELADSIRQQGMIQPVVVRPAADGYELIAGERRWRAACQAGLASIPALVRDVEPSQAMILAMVENLQREDLNPLEKALGMRTLQEQFGLSQQKVAEALGMSRVSVTNLLRLLGLEAELRQLLEEGRLEFGHGRALAALPADKQLRAAEAVVNRNLSVRQTEELAQRLQQEGAEERPATPQDANILALQRELSDRVGARILIRHNASGAGRLILQYNSLEELDGIIARIH